MRHQTLRRFLHTSGRVCAGRFSFAGGEHDDRSPTRCRDADASSRFSGDVVHVFELVQLEDSAVLYVAEEDQYNLLDLSRKKNIYNLLDLKS